jgi:hypothetical protein
MCQFSKNKSQHVLLIYVTSSALKAIEFATWGKSSSLSIIKCRIYSRVSILDSLKNGFVFFLTEYNSCAMGFLNFCFKVRVSFYLFKNLNKKSPSKYQLNLQTSCVITVTLLDFFICRSGKCLYTKILGFF